MVVQLVVLILAFCTFIEVQSSSPPLSDEEISRLSPDLQVQFVLPSHSLQPHHTRVGFKHRYVDHYGNIHASRPAGASITVDATTTVSDLALSKACTIIALMTRHMSSSTFSLVSRAHGVGIFAKSEGMGVYPENYNLRDTAQCRGKCSGSCAHTCTFDGRKYDSIAGLTNTRSVVLDDNILCNAQDPYGHQENVLVHEFSHQVHKYMSTTDRNRVHMMNTFNICLLAYLRHDNNQNPNFTLQLEYIFNYIKQRHVWKDGYGTANSAEYWAEASSSFFHTVIRSGYHSPAVGMDECSFNHVCRSESENRQWIKTHDVWLYNLLVKVYTNNRPSTPSGLRVCM
ncbi:unnamed protein product [Mytilus coruscus]|uniref:Lysine-specific metallo-endopeptidase domain-containing protein n=1 Tax=Mytilus coruscus TaxID=42192 RepID=A0A6J8ARW5_MYTCO|nr:unnamed protein product [Mytilus coruscus]